MLCLVCGDTASGIHYGVLSCEGCKGFFRRALQDKRAHLRKCIRQDCCKISLKTRNHCQPCRLRRCLELGMSREAAKLGRRSRKTWKHLDLSIALHGQHLGEVEDGGSLPATAAASAPGGPQSGPKFTSSLEPMRLKPRIFEDGNSPLGSDATFTALSSIPSVETSASGGSGGDWVSTPVPAPGIDEEYFAISGQKGVNTGPPNTPGPHLGDNQKNGLVLLWMGDNEGSQKTSVSPTAANTSQTGQESFQRKRLRPIKPRIRPSSTPAQSLTQQNMPLITQPPAAMQTKQLRAVNQSSENTETLHLVAGPKATPILTSTAMQQSKTAAHTRNRKRLIRFPKRCALPSPDISPDGGSLLTELLRTIESSFCVTFRDHLVYPAFKRSQEQIHAANEATLQHLFGVVKWEDGRPHTAQAFEVRHKSFQAFQTCFDRIMQDAVKFAKRIPGFSDLLPEDRMVLVQSGCFELACVIFSFYVDEESQTFCGPGNFTLSQSQMWLTFPMSKKFVNLLFDFAFQVQSYRLEPLKLGLLLAVLLVTPDREGLTNHEEVTWLRDLICQAFRFQLMVTNSNGVSLFNHLVSSTKEELHRLASEHRRQLINMRAAGFTFQNDLYSETFNLV